MYCPYPYSSVHINPQGKVRPCCRFNGYIKNDQKQLNLKDIFYGNNMTSLRNKFDSLKKGEFTKSCFRCYNEEQFGTKSLREKYPYKITTPELQMVELLFSNICNFKCRTCNSTLSTRWRSDDKVLIENGFNERYLFDRCEIDNVNYDGINTIKLMKITGGEPFMYSKLEENLYNISNQNKDCSIWIYTNGSIFPNDNIIKILKKFKRTSIGVSIDGFDDVNDYIRYGSIWKQIEENINKFKSCGFDVHLVTVISAYSLPRLKQLLDWWGPGNHIFVYLQKPNYLDINVLSEDILNKAVTDLKDYKLPFMPIIKNTTKQDDVSFKLYTKLLDELRNQDYESIT